MLPGSAPSGRPADTPRRLDPLALAFGGMELLSTPRLVVYRRSLEANIERLRGYLDGVVPGSGFRHVAPHVKTHKSLRVMEILLERGIESFKCTPNELGLCLDAGAKDIFVAYPLLAHDADRVAACAAACPEARITAQVSRIEHAERLAAAARRHGVEVDCLIDLDVGGRRTGALPQDAPELARAILRSSRLGPLRLRGLHAYDGHNRSPSPDEREACSEKAMSEVAACALELAAAGARVDRIIAGGTPGFLPDLKELVSRHRIDADVKVSPGTWVYWDTLYDALMPGMFELAAFVLAQVIDQPAEDLVTLNAGHKRWAIDQGPVELFSVPGLELVSASEEHAVLRRTGGPRVSLEDRIFIAPRHVCPTINAWETFTLVGMEGDIEAASVPVSARNR